MHHSQSATKLGPLQESSSFGAAARGRHVLDEEEGKEIQPNQIIIYELILAHMHLSHITSEESKWHRRAAERC